MEDLTKSQLVTLVLLVSFITSLVTGIVTVSLVDQSPAPLTQTIQRVIEQINPLSAGNNNNQQASIEQSVSYNPNNESLVKLIKSVSSSVVSVVASKDIPIIEQYYINPFQNDPFFQNLPPELIPNVQIPQYRQKGTTKQQVSSGTGFFISKDGLLLTNKHVVEDTTASYSIVMNDGRKLDAKVLARDPFQDIAILKIEGNDFNPIPLGNSDNINVGQGVIAIGNALGQFTNTVSQGIISGLNRSVTAQGSLSGPEDLTQLIQTDAAINPGNSGGPLLDFSGHVIGINVAVAESAQSIGFSLPINIAKRDVNDAIDFGQIKYPYIGISYKGTDKGLSLTAVVVNGPAFKAGLKEGDVITQINGKSVTDQNGLVNILSMLRVGDKVELKVLRNGNQEMNFTVTLEERPSGT